jgi:transposase
VIRSSKHFYNKILNTGKNKLLQIFLEDYTYAVNRYVEYFYTREIKAGNRIFSINKDLLDFPPYISYNICKFDTRLSARALNCACDQAQGIIKSLTAKRKKLLWLKEKLITEGKELKYVEKRLVNHKFSMPVFQKIWPELSSKCVEFNPTPKGHFKGYLRLRAIGDYGHIKIPITQHKQSRKWGKRGTQLGSYLITENYVCLRYEIPDKPQKQNGKIIGIDQGMKDCITTSNKLQKFNHPDNHTLESIMNVMTKKKKGSKAFKRLQDLRKNFINWTINQINTKNIKQINLEEIYKIRNGKRSSRKLSHWTYTLIEEKLQRYCEENGVRFQLQSSTYRSQRCSCCGLVRKANRKGKIYSCKSCGYSDDSDFNAAKNHEIELPDIPFALRKMERNRGGGFYWLSSGFFDLSGQELRVPDSSQKVN